MTPQALKQLHQLIASTNSVRLSHTAAELPKHPHNEALPVLVIDHPIASAKCLLHGAQLLSFSPKGDSDWLWVSPVAALRHNAAIRGGIPICFPWFGPHKEDPSKPKHGFARQSEWQLEDIQSHTNAISLTFRLNYTGNRPDLHTQPFRIECQYTLGKTLTIGCYIHNTSKTEQSFSYAFHSYFAIGDLGRTQVKGLDSLTYLDNTQQQQAQKQSGDIGFTQEVDRLFPRVDPDQQLISTLPKRAINLYSPDQKSCIVWNPGKDLAQKMPDISMHYNEFVCIERGNIEENTIKLLPNQSHKSLLTISNPIK
ncbi:MAG: D-hexose-6-phosphate mutarotase [Cellvibrionales bacterium]|nr:D-hexose-6-phosphate mutarotase [Cellvibrionales bacterium]